MAIETVGEAWTLGWRVVARGPPAWRATCRPQRLLRHARSAFQRQRWVTIGIAHQTRHRGLGRAFLPPMEPLSSPRCGWSGHLAHPYWRGLASRLGCIEPFRGPRFGHPCPCASALCAPKRSKRKGSPDFISAILSTAQKAVELRWCYLRRIDQRTPVGGFVQGRR